MPKKVVSREDAVVDEGRKRQSRVECKEEEKERLRVAADWTGRPGLCDNMVIDCGAGAYVEGDVEGDVKGDVEADVEANVECRG
jgi:hypothetical protein